MLVFLPDCGDPTPVDGTANITLTTYGAVVEITCEPGFDLSGPSVVSCTTDGTWSDNPTCNANGKIGIDALINTCFYMHALSHTFNRHSENHYFKNYLDIGE